MQAVAKMMEPERHKKVAQEALVMRKPSQERGGETEAHTTRL